MTYTIVFVILFVLSIIAYELRIIETRAVNCKVEKRWCIRTLASGAVIVILGMGYTVEYIQRDFYDIRELKKIHTPTIIMEGNNQETIALILKRVTISD